METPNYVLKINDRDLLEKNNTLQYFYLKKIFWAIVAVLIIGSLVFQENLFLEMSFIFKILMIGLGIWIISQAGNKNVESPLELQFYDDYLIFYSEKRYYNPKTSRKEYEKMYYKDIRECNYRMKRKRIIFSGIYEGTYYKYKKDGSLETKPCFHKTVDAMTYIDTMFEPDIDFVAEIEAHSPIKVVADNT